MILSNCYSRLLSGYSVFGDDADNDGGYGRGCLDGGGGALDLSCDTQRLRSAHCILCVYVCFSDCARLA